MMPLLATQFHVQRLGYFAPFATGQAGPKSDVDIMAEFSKLLGWDFFEIEELLEQALNRKVDLVTPAALSNSYEKASWRRFAISDDYTLLLLLQSKGKKYVRIKKAKLFI